MSLSVQTHPNRSLAETARRICESRGGKWSGTKGMACCPAHDDRTPSLGVSLGRQAILFHCFAGCDQQSVLAALAREGFEAPALFAGSATTNEPESTSTRKPSAVAVRIWRDAQPLRASPAKAYLESRGILAASPALRFHPRTPLGPKGRARFLPAMIAAVSLDETAAYYRRQMPKAKATDQIEVLSNEIDRLTDQLKSGREALDGLKGQAEQKQQQIADIEAKLRNSAAARELQASRDRANNSLTRIEEIVR